MCRNGVRHLDEEIIDIHDELWSVQPSVIIEDMTNKVIKHSGFKAIRKRWIVHFIDKDCWGNCHYLYTYNFLCKWWQMSELTIWISIFIKTDISLLIILWGFPSSFTLSNLRHCFSSTLIQEYINQNTYKYCF